MSKISRALSWYAGLTAAATFLLLIAGGLVTSTDSGLSVPDWPLSYGQFMPPMIGGIRYEHTHRLIAAVVGVLIAILAGWLWRCEPRRWVRRMGYAALGAVITQAILGGLTVLWVLPAPISIAHACLGQVVFCLVVLVATSDRQASAPPECVRLRMWCLLTTVLLGGQLVLGAVLRHTGYALSWHVANAMVITGLIMHLCLRLRHHPLGRLAGFMVVVVVGQVLLGLFTVFSHQQVMSATAHVALGALLLASSCVLTVGTFLFFSRSANKKIETSRFFADYLALTKPRLTALALVATGVGFLVGSPGHVSVMRLAALLMGAGCIGGGANALNQWMERDADALMRRTQTRPLPAGRLTPVQALTFGVALTGCGVWSLGVWVNGLTAVLAALTAGIYLGLYTPMKRVSSLCTLIGAIPGAMPPLMGWAAARGSLNVEAWALFALLFVWQLPHFLAIAWTHREEYARAGFQMLPVVDPDGSSTARQIILYGAALLPISLLPTLLGTAGAWYFLGAMILGVWFVGMAVSAARTRSAAVAHRLFLASVGYLPAVLTLMVIDKRPI